MADRPSLQRATRRVRRQLRLAFGEPERPEAVPTPPEAVPSPLVDFVAYGEDCLLSGQLRLDADRLTDLLNEHEDFVLINVHAADLGGGAGYEVREVLVPRDELLLVHATGPRGGPQRRIRTRPFPVALRVGPFDVRGYLHSLPGSDPLESFRRRPSMIPVTDAWIEYLRAGRRERRRVDTLIVNRHRVEWIVEAVDEEVEMPELPLHALQSPFAKDMTGHVHSKT